MFKKTSFKVTTHVVHGDYVPPAEPVHISRVSGSFPMRMPAGFDQWSPEQKAQWTEWLKQVEKWMSDELDKTPPGWDQWTQEQQQSWFVARAQQLSAQVEATYAHS